MYVMGEGQIDTQKENYYSMFESNKYYGKIKVEQDKVCNLK